MRRRKDIARLAAISAGVLLICGAMCQSTAGLEPIGVIGRGRLRQAEYLPDGRVLLVLDDRVDVAADDLETVLYSFAARSRGMGGVTVSHDGSRVAITTTRRKPERMTLEIWEVDSGVLLSEWTKIEPAGSFALNANLTAAVKYIGGDVLSVDVATGAVLGRFPVAEPEDDVRVALNPDATLVFVRRLQPVGERNGQPVWEWSTALWRRDLGQAVAVLRPKRDAWTYRATYDDAEFSPDGRWVAVRDGAQRITLWNVATGEEAWTSALPNSSRDIAFSHDSRSVHAFTDRLWTRAVDGSPPVLMGGGFEFPDGAAVSPDGTTALLRYRHGPLEEWDVATNVRRRFSTVHAAPESWGSALSADGRYVASIPGRVVTIWDLQHGDVARTVAPDDGFWCDAVASPSTPLFAVAHDLHIETRSFPSGKLVARSAAYFSDDVVAFSSDGAYLAFDGGRLDIAVSDATTGETVALLDMDPPDGHYSSVRRLVFGAGHRFLAARDREGWMYVWEWTGARYALRHTWEDTAPSNALLQFEPRGRAPKLVVSWTPRSTAPSRLSTTVWDVSGHAPVRTTTLDERAIAFVEPWGGGALNPVYLLTDNDDQLSIWDWTRRKKLADTDVPKPFAVTADGSVALAVDRERGRVTVWDLRELLPRYGADPRSKQLTGWGSIRQTALLPNFPNPFNPETWIPFSLAETADVVVDIYDARGARVRGLELGSRPAGAYTSRDTAAYWDGRNAAEEVVGSGVYYYRLNAEDDPSAATTRAMFLSK